MILDTLFTIGLAIGLPIGACFLFLWGIGVIEHTTKVTEDT